MTLDGWAGLDSDLSRYIAEESRQTLGAYRAQPNLIAEHANVEQDTAHGGYQHRQLFELVQNSADALWTRPPDHVADSCPTVRPRGRVEVRLTEDCLYCADDGEPINEDGVRALMFSHLSPKRKTSQIGTFGLGFKAVLGVSDSPEFFGRSGSFRFDRARSERTIRTLNPHISSYPVLRLPEAINPAVCFGQDAVLQEMAEWAVNIVRLPLRQGAGSDLRQQMRTFPAEFLLFVSHVQRLALSDASGAVSRVLKLARVDDGHCLTDRGVTSRWRLFERTHRLSEEARADRRPGDDRDELPVTWAAPLDRLDRPGKFWSFFPTNTASLVPGILNAPWKRNEDRQNLLDGRYNDELIGSAAELLAEALPSLTAADDPARHLDALPRRREAGDSDQADLLRERLFAALDGRCIVPDQNGRLCPVRALFYPPEDLTAANRNETAALDRWASHPGRPHGWIHNRALSRTRLAAINRMFQPSKQPDTRMGQAPRASIAVWLEALVKQAEPSGRIAASMAAIQVAALIPEAKRSGTNLGAIVMTASAKLHKPDPDLLFLPDPTLAAEATMDPESSVHPTLVADRATLAALKELGLQKPSADSQFKRAAKKVFEHRGLAPPADGLHERFWRTSRRVNVTEAMRIITEHRDWRRKLRIRTRTGRWVPPHSVLMPGRIVPGDGSGDNAATVDVDFHGLDQALLAKLEITEAPATNYDISSEAVFHEHQERCADKYRERDDLPNQPRAGYLEFTSIEGVGPLTVLSRLSDEGQVLYTDALLMQDASYKPLPMWHNGTNRESYPKVDFESLAVHMIRMHGRIALADQIVPFADALGPHPKSPAALHALLRHPKADMMRRVFELSDPRPVLIGEGDPIPLTDVWPGLAGHLPAHRKTTQLVLCDQIRVAEEQRDCVFQPPSVHLAGNVEDHESRALTLVSRELELDLTKGEIEAILRRTTPEEIRRRRSAISRRGTDAERVLAAVGEARLRHGLPQSLVAALSHGRQPPSGIDLAEAAIATHHTDTLRQFRGALDLLGPPAQWAGSPRAREFVRSLGFSEEWAGERNRRRTPFLEVDGPLLLPKLHDYQRIVADNLREMLRAKQNERSERRGMISMPTGSGKTRVAVEAIVQAMRDDGFRGGVLWVADRDELCEQAVEAWRQVWRSRGATSQQLRISRMWSGQPRPLATADRHVVVATVQTLHARLSNASRQTDYDFLRDFKLVVFDEAHRSIAPTFTSVMREIGLTHRSTEDEPFLLGLTATPYRGRDEAETARLVRRYGSSRLDTGAFSSDDSRDVVSELQDMGVLAQADQKLIHGGRYRLTADELEEIGRFTHGTDRPKHFLAWLPQSVEDRMGRDTDRTERIIGAYMDHVERDWPTLIFATSVEHAQTVAALLNLKGIKARCVSGSTEPATRRGVVESFRRGDISVLTNYGVFREGFDAPKTRAIIVARPVYSPNLYFQMVGRGLRGPKNGGDERCLILNVRDTIDNFGEELAFSELDWLWDR